MEDNRVSLNGVKVHPFKSRAELMTYVDKRKGILVAINAEKILHATDQTRSIINRNIGYCDGYGAVMALKKKGYEKNDIDQRFALRVSCGNGPGACHYP